MKEAFEFAIKSADRPPRKETLSLRLSPTRDAGRTARRPRAPHAPPSARTQEFPARPRRPTAGRQSGESPARTAPTAGSPYVPAAEPTPHRPLIRAQAEVLFALRRKRAGKADARIRHGGDKSIQRTSVLHVRRAQFAERRSEQPKRRPVADCRLIQMRLRISQPLLKSIQRVRPSAQQLALLEQRLPLGENLVSAGRKGGRL